MEQMKLQLRQNKNYTINSDLEVRMHSLTQTLIDKQSHLETLTTERNAMRLQLEKLEVLLLSCSLLFLSFLFIERVSQINVKNSTDYCSKN